MNIHEIGTHISNFINRKKIAKEQRLARVASITFARLSLKATEQGDKLGAQLYEAAMDKAVADFLPQQSSSKPTSSTGSVR